MRATERGGLASQGEKSAKQLRSRCLQGLMAHPRQSHPPPPWLHVGPYCSALPSCSWAAHWVRMCLQQITCFAIHGRALRQ